MKIIDVLHHCRTKGRKKLRNYRVKARRSYPAIAESKRVGMC